MASENDNKRTEEARGAADFCDGAGLVKPEGKFVCRFPKCGAGNDGKPCANKGVIAECATAGGKGYCLEHGAEFLHGEICPWCDAEQKRTEIRRLNRGHPDLPVWERTTYDGLEVSRKKCTCHPADAAEFDKCYGKRSFSECCAAANAEREAETALTRSDLLFLCVGSTVIFLMGSAFGLFLGITFF